MGLDFSEGNAHWSYSNFHRFRKRLAWEIGVNLDLMKGFVPFRPGILWDNIDDDIVPLLNHSDCDGDLSPEECGIVGPRLRELVQDWNNDHDKQNAIFLATAMETCNRTGQRLMFL